MYSTPFHPWAFFYGAAAIAAIGLTGCGNTCFAGFSINGNGAVIVRAGNPPPVCSFTPAKGAVTALAVKSPVCESCTAPAGVAHIFVTVRGIQLRQSPSDDPNSPGWIEIAADLEHQPLQIDLLGNSAPAILVENVMVPAGIYRDVRLQFLAASPWNAEPILTRNSCPDPQRNCIVMGDGRTDPLYFPGDAPELLILPEGPGSNALTVLPDARMELRLNLELRQASYFSTTEGWKTQNVIVGQAKLLRQNSSEDVPAI
jgi:Domain of unknown function (DUF4382)